MKTLHFDDYEDFVIAVSEKYDGIKANDDLDSIDIIGKYEDIKEIMANLIIFGYGIAIITEFADPSWDNYEDEFILSLYDNEVWCEPAKRKTDYLHPEAKVVYLLDDCNSKIIPLIESDEVYEVRIGEDECDGDCENCACENKLSSTATYKVNGKEVSEKEYNKALDNFHDRYMDGIASMLLGYSEFIDEMNEWKKLFNW